MSNWTTIRIRKDLFLKLKEIGDKENRSVANLLENIIRERYNIQRNNK